MGKKKVGKSKRTEGAAIEFAIQAPLLHGKNLDFSKSIYKGSKEEIEVRCLIHGVYTTTPGSLLQGCGCKQCGRKKAGIKKSNGLPKFIEKAIAMHGEATYDYSLVKYINNKTDVSIICPLHGSFLQTPDAHAGARGQGCPECGHIRSNQAKKLTFNQFLARATHLHKDMFIYEKESYNSTKDSLNITCLRCGKGFKQTPTDHFNCSEPCPVCGKRYLDGDVFIERANKVHKNRYTYPNLSFKSAKDHVLILCQVHGEFSQIADNHQAGNGCPRCADYINSRGSKRIAEYLTKNNVPFESEKKFHNLRSKKCTPLRFDFFLAEYSLLIEFDGRQHFEPVSVFGGEDGFNDLIENDRLKNEWAIQNSYHLVRISFSDENLIEEMLDSYFIDHDKNR